MPAETAAGPEQAQGCLPGTHLTWVPGRRAAWTRNMHTVPGTLTPGKGWHRVIVGRERKD